ncbi:spermidine synthase [Nonomuraea sp. NPDC050153]|uniref:spermidine synthase n=1 Tax=Nonomuraea sp. NPDC050153 TaxID=3364359 RepID=UPI00379D095E
MPSDLYARSNIVVHSQFTTLDGSRVFVGSQPDDFALAGLLAPGSRICMLGTGLGGAIRPILALAPDAGLVCVDADEQMHKMAGLIYARHFPELAVEMHMGDAWQYVRSNEGAFDAVCVDLYGAGGHADFVFDIDFWRDISKATTPGGVVLVNAWGLPSHLRPLSGDSPQHEIATLLRRIWEDVRYIPNRRNLTFIAGFQGECRSVPELPGDLSGIDKAIACLLPLRFRYASPVEEMSDYSLHAARHTSLALDEEMIGRWPNLLKVLARTCEAEGFDPDLAMSGGLLGSESAADRVTLRLLDEGRAEADYIPVMAAAQAFRGLGEGDWFGPWVINARKTVGARHPAWYVNVALWQALAMAAFPLAPRAQWVEQLADMAIEISRNQKG